MIPKIKNQKKSVSAFTLIEMVIVLVIMGIMLMATLYLSGEQIQKVKDKTVKESILAEMQSRYSRNLGSSSFAGMMYDTMEVTINSGENKINFMYTGNNDYKENSFTDRFEIKKIIMNYSENDIMRSSEAENISLEYTPYKISCKIGDDEANVVIIARVNDSRDYCFEIQRKNCRLMELSESKCDFLTRNPSPN